MDKTKIILEFLRGNESREAIQLLIDGALNFKGKFQVLGSTKDSAHKFIEVASEINPDVKEFARAISIEDIRGVEKLPTIVLSDVPVNLATELLEVSIESDRKIGELNAKIAELEDSLNASRKEVSTLELKLKDSAYEIKSLTENLHREAELNKTLNETLKNIYNEHDKKVLALSTEIEKLEQELEAASSNSAYLDLKNTIKGMNWFARLFKLPKLIK